MKKILLFIILLTSLTFAQDWVIPILMSDNGTTAVDTLPTQFNFTDKTNLALSTADTSAGIVLAGFDSAYVSISGTGGTYRDGLSGTFKSTTSVMHSGDTVYVRNTTSGSYTTAVNTVLTVGSISDTYSITTKADNDAPSVPTSPLAVGSIGMVTFTWADPVDADLGKIYIYRGTSTNPTILLDSVNAGVQTYKDTANTLAEETVYYYRIKSVDTLDNASDYSSNASDTVLSIMYAVDLAGTVEANEYMSKTTPTNLDLNGAERCSTATDASFEIANTNWADNGNHTIDSSTTYKQAGSYSGKIVGTIGYNTVANTGTFTNAGNTDYNYNTFTGATTTGFTASGVSANGAYVLFQPSASFIPNARYMLRYDLVVDSGTAPYIKYGVSPGVLPQILTVGTNQYIFTTPSNYENLYVSHDAGQTADFILSNVRIYRLPKIICDGDSRTLGNAGTTYPYTKYLQDLISDSVGYVMNVAVSGQTSTNRLANINANVLSKYSGSGDINIINIGVNDFTVDSTISVDSVYKNIKNYCLASKAAGFKVGVMTVLLNNYTGTPAPPTTANSKISILNDSLRSHYSEFADYLIDEAADSNLDDPNNTTYFHDGLHLKDAGNIIVANLTYNAINNVSLPMSNFTPLVSGEKYTLELYAYENFLSNDTLRVNIGSQTKAFTWTADSTWQKKVWNFQATANEVNQPIKLYLNQADTCYVDAVSLTQAYDLMVSLWFMTTDNTTAGNFVNKWTGGVNTNPGFTFIKRHTSWNGFYLKLGGGTVYKELIPVANQTSIISNGSYHNLATVVNRTSDAGLYLDGAVIEINGSADITTIGKVINTNPLGIGADANGSTFLNGKLGEVQITRFTSLPANIATLISDNYYRGLNKTHLLGSYTGGTIVGWWKWSGATDGAMLNDYSTSNNDLTGSGVTQAADQVILPTGYVTPADTVPSAFTFTDVIDVGLSSSNTSNGVNIDCDSCWAYAAGDSFKVNAGALRVAGVKVYNTDDVYLTLVASASNSTAVNSTLTAGGVSDTYTVTTLASSIPDAPTSLAVTLVNENVNPNLPYELTYTINNVWQGWVMQTIANQEKATIVDNPLYDTTNASPSVGRLEIVYGDDFTGVANEYPRAQMTSLSAFYGGFDYPYGHVFKITWDDFLPADFVINEPSYTRTNTILAQFRNEGQSAPILSVGLDSTSYYFNHYITDPPSGTYYKWTKFGDPASDRGKWQHWEMRFLYDSTTAGWSVLYHNGLKVDTNYNARTYPIDHTSTGVAFDQDVYTLYLGTTDSLTRYVDNTKVEDLTDGSVRKLSSFGTPDANLADSIIHYNTLTFTKDNATDSVYVYSNSVNDTVTATKIGTTYASTYNDTVDISATYYWLKSKTTTDTSYFSSVVSDSVIYALNPPEGLTAVGTPLNVNLSWTNVDDYGTIKVYRSASGVLSSPTWIGNSTTTTYQDTGVYGTYYYWVRGLQDGTLSDYSIGDTAQALSGSEMIADSININMEVTGADIITNGTFTSNITGWDGNGTTPKWYNTDWNGTGLTAYLPIALDSVRSATTASMYRAASPVNGTMYLLTFNFFVDSANVFTNQIQPYFQLGTQQDLGYSVISEHTWNTFTKRFIATGTNTRFSLTLRKNSGGGNADVNDQAYFDNISCKPVPYWTTNGNQVVDTSTAFKQTGSYSTSLTASGAGNGSTNAISLASTLFTAVTSGHNYRLKLYAYTTTATTTLTYLLGDKTEGKTVSTVGMTEIDYDFTATASTTGALYLYTDKAATVYIDMVSLTEQ